MVTPYREAFWGVVLCALVGFAQTRAPYRDNIPNGYDVPLPDGSPGVCGGVGHTSCAGGGARNQFGEDFHTAGFTWTKELCAKDSDGDGLTNGQELGDPCCKWSLQSGVSPEYSLPQLLGHPGFASSVPISPLNPTDLCKDSGNDPAVKEPVYFSEGEKQLIKRVAFNFSIPPVGTTYYNVPFNFDVDTNKDTMTFVGFDTIVRNPRHLHHFLVFACTEVWPEEVAGVAINQEGSLNTDAENAILFRMHTTCVESFYLWNPGQPALVLPKDIGYTVGKGTNARSFVVQIHYDNQNMVEGETDTSEIVMYHTPYKRKFDMGVFSPGSVLLNHQVLPRKTKSIYYSQRCAVWMNTSVASEVQAFIHIPHMHYAGKSVWSEVIGTDVFSDKPKLLAPGDKPFRELARMDSFDPDLQFWYPVNLTLKHGDLIATTCIFDTSDREDEVRGGLATLDEMCVNNMFFYPREAIPAVFCAGDSVDNDPPFYGIWPEGLSSVLGLDPLAEALLTPKKALRNGFPAASPFYPLIAEEDQAGRIEAEHVPAEPLEDDTQEVSSAGPIRIWAVLSIISAVVLGEILSVVILV